MRRSVILFAVFLMIAAASRLEAQDQGQAADSASDNQTKKEGWHFSSWATGGRVDAQIMSMQQSMTGMDSMSDVKVQMMALELETRATLNNGNRDVVDFALQWPYYTQMEGVDGRGKPMHFFNAYGIFKLGLGKPNIRFGQFVIPFGNLTYYETHAKPLQSLFPESLGIRLQRGVGVEGILADYDYWIAIAGDDKARSVTGRLARRLDLSHGILSGGVSALYGRHLPRFSSLLDPLMDEAFSDMPLDHSIVLTDKLRAGVDVEYSSAKDLWRAEVISGSDSDGLVNGQFLQWNHNLTENNTVTAQIARWDQPSGDRIRFGGWYERKIGKYATIRVWAEHSRGRTNLDRSGNETMAGLQCILEKQKLLGR
jgi:hypothetical protein